MCFTFRFVIYFELIFVKGVSSVSRFLFLHMDAQLFQHCLLKEVSLLHCMTCDSLLWEAATPCMGLSLQTWEQCFALCPSFSYGLKKCWFFSLFSFLLVVWMEQRLPSSLPVEPVILKSPLFIFNCNLWLVGPSSDHATPRKICNNWTLILL